MPASGLRPKWRGLARALADKGAERSWDGAAVGGAPALRGLPGLPTEYHGPKGVPPSRLRMGRTHRFNAVTVRWCGGSVQRCAAVSLPKKGSTAVRSQSYGEGRER
jgi:hypothetical protein